MPKTSKTWKSQSDWASYTPTFQGFGTPTNVQFQWRRVGDSVEIQGKFTTGSSTAAEARAGLPGGLTSADTSKIPTLIYCGPMTSDLNEGSMYTALVEPSVTYVTFGYVNGALVAPLTKRNGNVLGSGSSGQTFSFFARVPIAGWSSSD